MYKDIEWKKIMNNIVFFTINSIAAIFLCVYMTIVISKKTKVIVKLEKQKDSLDRVKDSLDIEIYKLHQIIITHTFVFATDSLYDHGESLNIKP